MDRAIVLSILLLVGLTWLLYKLAAFLEPRAEKPATAPKEASLQSPAGGNGISRQKLIHQRLRK